MSIVQHLAVLALRQIVGTLVGETAADEVFKRCSSLFENQEQRLTRALQQANDEAWRTLRIVLTGESVWSWLGDFCKNRGDKSFREEISALLDVNLTLGQRDQCFQELLAAEKAGILRTGRIERVEVTRRVSAFARLSNEFARIEEEWRAVDQIATELRAKGYSELAKFISLRPTQPQGASLVALAVRYYFNRAVNQDAELRERLGLMIQDTILTEQREAFEFLGNTLHGIKGQLHVIQRVVSDTASSTAETRTILENLVELVKAILAIHRGPESLPTGVPVLAVGRPPQPPGPPVALDQVPYGRPLRCFRGHSGKIEQVAFSDRPTEFVHSAAWDNTVRRWSVTTGKLDRHVEELFGLVHTVFSPDGRHAHLIGIDKYGFLQSGLPRPSTQDKSGRQNLEMTSKHVSFRHVDMLYGFLVNSRPWQGGPPIVSPLAVSPDGGFLLWGDDLSEINCGGLDGTSVGDYFSFRTADQLFSYRVTALALTWKAKKGIAGIELRSGEESSQDRFPILVWDIQNSELEQQLNWHSGLVNALTVALNSNWAASGSADGTIRVWEIETGRELACLSAHEGEVLSVAFSFNNRMLISGGQDGVVRVWDLETHREACRCTGHDGEVRAVTLSPCGRFALSGGADKTVRLWELTLPASLLETPMKIRLGKRGTV